MLRAAAGVLGRRSLIVAGSVATTGPKRAFSRTPIRMVEGHQCHRVGHFHRKKLLGRSFIATSPNGRFTDGAAAISGKPLLRIEVHGKNLFYFFGDKDTPQEEEVCMHFHFGMSGAFSVLPLPGKEPTPTTRLALKNEEDGIVAHLSAMTVQHGGMDLYNAKAAALGEDPLREDADPEAVWAKVSVSKKPIGLLLMDQTVIAGAGNIYRAEILFKAGVHPEQPGNSLSRETFNTIWSHTVELLRRGFESGSILTVDPAEAAVLGPPWTRRYIYNQASCGRCKGAVQTWDMAARKVYCCITCQPLIESGDVAVAAGRKKAMAGATKAVTFVSHCAPDDAADGGTPLVKLTLAKLRERLESAGLSTKGKKAELIARLEGASAENSDISTGEKKQEEEAGEDAVAAVPTPDKLSSSSFLKRSRSRIGTTPFTTTGAAPEVYPEIYSWGGGGAGAGEGITEMGTANASVLPASGTAGIKHVATPREAAEEKAAVGEGKNVEHVALHDVAEEELIESKKKGKKGCGGKGRRLAAS